MNIFLNLFFKNTNLMNIKLQIIRQYVADVKTVVSSDETTYTYY